MNERLREAPKPARLVTGRRKEDGPRASHATNQLCTADSYLAACQETGEEPAEETLDALKARQWQQRVPVIFRDGEPEVRGDGAGDDGLSEINERLRSNFAEFRLDQVSEETVGVLPVLSDRPITDVGAAYREWDEAGQPEPTPEEIAQYEHASHAGMPIWADGSDVIRPPAKPLEVSTKNAPHAHLPTDKPKIVPRHEGGLTLPAIRVGVMG